MKSKFALVVRLIPGIRVDQSLFQGYAYMGHMKMKHGFDNLSHHITYIITNITTHLYLSACEAYLLLQFLFFNGFENIFKKQTRFTRKKFPI